MPGHEHGKSIKKTDEYEALKEQGYSKEKAARISNKAAQGPAARSQMAKKAAKSRARGTSRGKR
jgi:Holliday junction resolvasome RuvABC DNA-binding subunit